jgi:hypothetical protein
MKVSLVSDVDTGIRDVRISCTMGDRRYEGPPISDLSRWIVTSDFSNPHWPYKRSEEQSADDVSLWKELRQNGLKSGLEKTGWLALSIPDTDIKVENISKLRIEMMKPQRRESYRFTFMELSECEERVYDREFKQL